MCSRQFLHTLKNCGIGFPYNNRWAPEKGGKTMTALARPQESAALESACTQAKFYLETFNLLERLHRQLLDVIKDELDRREEREINSVQALLLFNVGDQELTRGRTAHARALSRLERLLQSEEARRSRLHPSRTFGGGPPLGAGAPDAKGRVRARHAARSCSSVIWVRWRPWAMSRPPIWKV
jgi:hypothetical protein